jgi:hypothetical protein
MNRVISMTLFQEIDDEQARMALLRRCVDVTAYRLRWTSLTREESFRLIQQTRDEVLELFPGKGDVFDLVIQPRFLRFMNERFMADWGALDAMN